MESYATEKGIISNSFQTLRQQLDTFSENFAEISQLMTETMQKKQKVANRAYSAAITDALEAGYRACQQERGE
jgi:hypothetical protein